jgi:hypothetical protein
MNLIEKEVTHTLKTFIFENHLLIAIFIIGLCFITILINNIIKIIKRCKKQKVTLSEIRAMTKEDAYHEVICIKLSKIDKKLGELYNHRILNMVLILITILPFSIVLSKSYFKNFEYLQPANLIEIKDYIKINNDKLTIENLPDKFYYKDKQLSKNTHHDFRIVKNDFYTDTDSTIKLIDKNQKEYTISKNELEELKRK